MINSGSTNFQSKDSNKSTNLEVHYQTVFPDNNS